MTMTGWANGKKRDFETLVVNNTSYTPGTHFAWENITYDVNPKERGNVTLLGGNRKYSLTKSSGLEIEATIVLNSSTTDSSDILYNLTQSGGNRGNNQVVIVEYADDGTTVVLRLTGDTTKQIQMCVGDITSDAGSVKFTLYIDCEGCTVAQA